MKRIMVRRGLNATLALFGLIVVVGSFDNCECVASDPQMSQPSQWVSTRSATPAKVVWHDDFEMGWRAAKKLKRPMVIYITSDHCHYCDAMKRDTWCDPSVLDRVKDGFVAIRLSPNRNAKTLGRIKVQAYPTTLIGHPRGKILAHRVGYQPPMEMHRLLETAAQPVH